MGQAAAKKILYEATKSPNSTKYYGNLVISKIRYEDGNSVTIQKFLGVKFKSPVFTGVITVDPEPYVEIIPEISYEPTEDKTVIAVTAQLNYPNGYTFDQKDTLSFEINGDLIDRTDLYTGSVQLYADYLPSGIVQVANSAAPDTALASLKQTLHLNQEGRTIELDAPLGATTPFKVISGTYAVTADKLATPEQTVIATTQISPTTVIVKTDETADIKVTYGAVDKYSALDVTIGALSPPVDKEELHVTVVERGTNKPIDFFSPINHKTRIRQKLSPSGTADVNAQVIVNNVKYFATKSVDLSNKLIQVTIAQADVKNEKIDTSGFVTLPVEVDTISQSDQVISVRLISKDKDKVYTQAVKAQTGSQNFTAPVAPGDYIVQAKSIIDKWIVYAVNVPTTLTVAKGGSTKLQLKLQSGANLQVRGFPDFLSFGGLSDLSDLDGSDFVAARASSLFKYAGKDGAGDPATFLTEDTSTTGTIQVAREVEKHLSDQQQVLPILISYTCNLSGGDAKTQLLNELNHAHSFANLILSLNLAKENGKQDVPAGYVVNPDFLGECQKGPFGKDEVVPVRGPLKTALDHWKVQATIPASITDTLGGYILAVNWLFRTVAKNVTFGWQVNLWGVGSSLWIYDTEPDKDGPIEVARKTADYIKSVGAYDGEYRPDFLAIDRYEGDDFTVRGYAQGYCYGPYEWRRFYDFVSQLSLDLQVPVAPWQIPASRIPSVSDNVNDLEAEHWGTGGTYIFGDEKINFDYHNIHPKILAIKPNKLVGAKTVEDIFIRGQPFDLTYPSYGDFPLRGIFAVLLGGGSTTGILSNIGTTGKWTQEQLNTYWNNRISLIDGSSASK